jgi:hypothetical protein
LTQWDEALPVSSGQQSGGGRWTATGVGVFAEGLDLNLVANYNIPLSLLLTVRSMMLKLKHGHLNILLKAIQRNCNGKW